MKRSSVIRLCVIGLVAAAGVVFPAFPGTAGASSSSPPLGPTILPAISTGTLQYLGTSKFSSPAPPPAGSKSGNDAHEFGPQAPGIDGIAASNRVRAKGTQVPKPPNNGIASSSPNTVQSFNGLTHVDSRTGTNEGDNKYSLEPPDQCNVAQGQYDLEGVNDALAVYRTGTGQIVAGPMGLNSFWKQPDEIIRSKPPVFGPSLGDINCTYDPGTQRYFLTVYYLQTDPQTGSLTGGGGTLIAVSTSSNLLGTFKLYNLPSTDIAPDDVNTRTGCPCFGDQPRIGTDANGFYVSVNEFSNVYGEGANSYFGAEVYAISKRNLMAYDASSGMPLPGYVRYANLINPAYVPLAGYPLTYNASIEPANSEGSYDQSQGGTEYFLSSNDYGFCLDNRITAWALTGTSALDSGGIPSLTAQFVTTAPYGCPPPATQKAGGQPYGKSQKNPNKPEWLNTDDERMQQAVYAAGKIWSTVDTRVKSPDGKERAGAEWFAVTPDWNSDGTFAPHLTGNGFVIANNDYLLYPAIAANDDGQAVMSFTLSGNDYYPSAAYAILDPSTGQFGQVHVAAHGQAPEDGFSGYDAIEGVCFDAAGNVYYPCARWGDYSAANVDMSNGHIWVATEYIPGAPGEIRTKFANWGTYITEVNPSATG